MPGYLSACSCRGKKPKKLESKSYYSRTTLLTQLIKNRESIRFLVAPSLFGKTSLVHEYAEALFSFRKVFWVDGKSPCFLRDLDNGMFQKDIEQRANSSSLLVVEDVPYLTAERGATFFGFLECACEKGWEVLATMAPACDIFEQNQGKIFRMKASDLLLSGEEIDARRTQTECAIKPIKNFQIHERIPALFWDTPSSPDRLLKQITQEDLPPEALLAFFVALVLDRGCFEDIAAFLKKPSSVNIGKWLSSYVYFQADQYREEFSAPSLSVESIAITFAPHLEVLYLYSAHEAKDALVVRLADVLLGRGQATRACQLMTRLVTSTYRQTWLAERNELLCGAGCFFDAHMVFESIKEQKASISQQLSLDEAARMCVLDRPEIASNIAYRLFQSRSHPESITKAAALVLLYTKDQDMYERSFAYLQKFHAGEKRRIAPSSQEVSDSTQSSHDFIIDLLIQFEILHHQNREEAATFAQECSLKYGPKPYQALMYLRLLGVDGCETNHQKHTQSLSELRAVIELCCDYIHVSIEWASLGMLEALLVIQVRNFMLAIEDMSLSEENEALLGEVITRAQTFETSLMKQREALEHHLEEKEMRREAFRKTHPDIFRSGNTQSSLNKSNPPKLRIDLLGGVDVRIEGKAEGERCVTRQKVKSLLTLLVINAGKELPRDRLKAILWPESNDESAQRNLHTVWCLLKKALSLADGTCPYLIRTQLSYRIESALITSDVHEFEELCRRILFGTPEPHEWLWLYSRITELYRGDLLPSERGNIFIEEARSRYRALFAEAASVAAKRLYAVREFDLALRFAQHVIAHDPTREDAYSIIMESQMAIGQRTSALATFFKCQKHLSEELGIDPSAKIKMLYQGIISEDKEAVGV